MQTDNELSPTVQKLLARAQDIPAADISQEIRDAAMRLKSDIKRVMKGKLSDDEEAALHDLLIGLDTLHRGRVPLIF
ncbi:MAG: hypothetical protein ACXIUP_07550 [Microcella sp.]